MRLCSIKGCGRLHEARNLCNAHYNRFKRGDDMAPPLRPRLLPAEVPATCQVDGCENPYWASGCCVAHYHARRKPTVPHRCSVEGCESGTPYAAKGFCKFHYNATNRNRPENKSIARQREIMMDVIDRAAPDKENLT
jgi:hypothetical protein